MNKKNILFKINGLTKKYSGAEGESIVFQNINFEIYKKEKVAILAPSGVGKTTLLNCLALLDNFNSGDIEFYPNEKDEILYSKIKEKEKNQIRQNNFGFIFQLPYLLKSFSVLDNVVIPLTIKKEKTAIREKKAIELLNSLFDKGQLIAQKPTNTMSGGELQRLAIARAIIHDPKVIFADEPTGNLDAEKGEEVLKLLTKKCNDNKSTLILVTHNKDFAKKYCDRILELSKNCIK